MANNKLKNRYSLDFDPEFKEMLRQIKNKKKQLNKLCPETTEGATGNNIGLGTPILSPNELFNSPGQTLGPQNINQSQGRSQKPNILSAESATSNGFYSSTPFNPSWPPIAPPIEFNQCTPPLFTPAPSTPSPFTPCNGMQLIHKRGNRLGHITNYTPCSSAHKRSQRKKRRQEGIGLSEFKQFTPPPISPSPSSPSPSTPCNVVHLIQDKGYRLGNITNYMHTPCSSAHKRSQCKKRNAMHENARLSKRN